MQTTGTNRVLVCVRQAASLAEFRHLYGPVGLDVAGHLLGSPDPQTSVITSCS